MKDANAQSPVKLIDIDAYTPYKIATTIYDVTIHKAALNRSKSFSLGVLAGIYLGFGAQFSTLVTSDSTLHYGITSLIEGIVYSLGFILAVIGGAEVFTGNCLGIIGFAGKKITLYELLTNWGVIYIGNLVGSLTMVWWMYETHQWEFFNHMVGAKALLIAHNKVNLSFNAAFTRGVLCNALICLAIWICFSGKSTADKIFSIIFPIGGFVASGFEQCVSNMYFIPMGIMLRKNHFVVDAAEKMAGRTLNLSQLTWKGFFINNLLPVTFGNIVGGVMLIGIMFWFIYLRPRTKKTHMGCPVDYNK
ncbi:formate/nitrite transporter [Candidatus Kuenenia stuttgartiensis]|uniref:Formate/nitrite transporter n=1 Tax=Kuenenia stuttgartiensis TaxID=174633 RepID=Q1Q4Z9_KUEST|nr:MULTISPECIES: formate/nitrite transporter family protein [Kuenenia]MBE7547103.1 formate/nitrite transporter family protein [Planctomycetia bacterium]MBZ0191078.1 formate/nitrite transporter family protein [Candidatus Kuenenia stuttgartiensis]MCF6151704.1 formate/nitrite transporter family protein [Candidatus Kuenenia stuttgartiensis]MCL4726530.1 formate/nitrite transporter family protein [Candidatus Kuenenia stuttgartiensis]MCZ7621364.1 formate/nitrite transporter family protein [Candidatus